MENGSVKFISGIWLFFLASISVFFVVYSLSAYQIQARIQAFSAGDQTFSVWRIKRLSNRLKERKALIAPASIAVQNTRNEIADVQRKIDEASQQKQSAESERDKYVREIVTYIRRAAGPDFDLAGFNSKLNSEGGQTVQGELDIITEADHSLPPEKSVDKQLMVNYRNNLDISVGSHFKVIDLEKKADSLKNELLTKISRRDSIEKNAISIFDGDMQVNKADQVKIEDFLDELNVLDVNFGFMGYMTQIPVELLTILLVICMGILGSSIYLTQSFFDSSTGFGLGFYIFRPFFGALTALALFIVIKAGVIVAIDPFQLSKSGAALNPFFVSFVGIVGGLISEQAVNRIRTSAQTWLKSSTYGRNRWAINVEEYIAKNNKSLPALFEFFDADAQTVTEWIEGKRETPPHAQRTIAAWIGVPSRNLFTDIPPSDRTAKNEYE